MRVVVPVLLVLFLLRSVSSPAAETTAVLSAGLSVGHLSWPDDEIIVGVQLTIHGGLFVIHGPSTTTPAGHVTGALFIGGPLMCKVDNNPESDIGRMACSYFQTSGPLMHKRSQLHFLGNWFKISTVDSVPSKPCNAVGCGITIEGDLRFAPYNSLSSGKRVTATTVTTTDFTFGDVTKNISVLQSKAEQGDVAAQVDLGTLYFNDEDLGVKRDYAQAAKWFGKAAEQGDATAQYRLGGLYASGLGVSQDYSSALKWWHLAAEHGNADAEHDLGGLIWNGMGVKQDHEEAVRWFRKAAEHGNPRAQHDLGNAYETAQGVELDYAEAAKWYRKAAEQDDSESQSALGSLYERGLGIPQDYPEAYFWQDLGCSCYEDSQKATTRFHLNSEQKGEVDRRVLEWRPTPAGAPASVHP